MDAIKIDDFSIEITKIEPVKEVKNVYQREFIEKQIKDITASRDAFVAQREIELAECNEILKAMDDAGVIAKPIEEIKPEVIPIREV